MNNEDDDDVGEMPMEAAPAPPKPDDKPKKGAGRPRGEIGAAPKKVPFENRDAELLWPEIMQKLPGMGHNVYELVVRVIRVEPPPREQIGKSFEASAIRGNESQIPGDALIAFVTQYYHVPFQQGPAAYELQWCWKSTGQIFAMGSLRLPSRDMIAAQYTAEWRMRQEQQQGTGVGSMPMGAMMPGGMPGMMPPPPNQQGQQSQGQSGQGQPFQQMMPPWMQMQPGFGYGPFGYQQMYPQPPQPQRDPEIDQLKSEMSEIKDLLRGLAARPPEPPQVQPMMPPPPPREPEASLDVLIARGVVQAMAAMGVVPNGGQAGVGAPPPQPQGVVQQASSGLDALEALAGIFQRTRRVQKQLAAAQRADDDEEEEEDEPRVGVGATPEGADDQQPQLGIALVDVGTTWRDGRPVKAAVDPKTGKFVFDQQGLMGIALGNPIIGESVMDFAQAVKQKMMQQPRTGLAAPVQRREDHQVQVRQVEHQVEPQPQLEEPTTEQPNGAALKPWVV